MQKTILLFFLFFVVNASFAQLKLREQDLNNLIAIGELYSNDVMLKGKTIDQDLEKLRTPKLNQLVNTLQTISKYNFEILDKKYLGRPEDDDLIMWFVLREIHYNRTSKTLIPLSSSEVAKRYLSEPLDSKSLVNNYYRLIQSPIAMLFNDKDFSEINFDLSSYGLMNEFEKAAFYLNIMDAFVARLKVLSYLKKNDKVLEYLKKFPTINNKEYYYFQDFNYEDFKWVGYEKMESYNRVHLGSLYNALSVHMIALLEAGEKEKAGEIYANSILSNPAYFEYSPNEKELKKAYETAKQ